MSSTKQTTRREWLDSERRLPARERAEARAKSPTLGVALVYPATYHIGMSSLGYQIVHETINAHPAAWAERFFLDSAPQGSIETGSPLRGFDVIAFSGSFEMDDPAVLEILEEAGIPAEAERRRAEGNWPLVVMGGVLISVNRLPLYPFIDAFIHGDAEAALPPVLDALSAGGASLARNARERLLALAAIPYVEVTPGARLAAGLDIPASMDRVARILHADGELDPMRSATVSKPDYEIAVTESILLPAPLPAQLRTLDRPPMTTQILSPLTEFSDMVLVDLARGCPHHCTFCWIGHNTPPYRQRAASSIIAAIEPWAEIADRFGLVSSAVGAHEEIDDLCRWMMARDLRVSYSSLRVEEVTQTMLEALHKGGQKTITIAPEAGNQRVRRLLGKRISDDQIIDVIERAMSLGTENIKLYYMVGIPSETDEEAMDIVRFSERIRKTMLARSRGRGRIGYLGFNLGVFVPKPNLPLNHIEPTPLAELKTRLKKVVQSLRRIPNTRLAVSSPDLAFAQTVLSVGGVESARYVSLARRLRGDWRAANRLWREEQDRSFDERRRLSRLASEAVRRNAGATAAS